MVADPKNLRFFVDENILGVGKALAIARKDVVHVGHPLIPEVPLGALDPEWIPAVAKRKLIVIGRDRHIRTKPGELALLHEYGLRIFWIAGKKDLGSWGTLVLLTKRWDAIEREIARRGPGPWFMTISETTIREITLT